MIPPGYPLRWQRFLSSLKMLAKLTICEGLGALLWLLFELSEPESRVFLFYSLERWGIILSTAFLVSLFIFMVWSVGNQPGWTLKALEYFKNENRAAGLLGVATFMFLVTLGTHIVFFVNVNLQIYYRLLIPFLLFLTLAVTQIWIFLVVSIRKTRIPVLKIWFPIYREVQSFFNTTDRSLLIGLIIISFVYVTIQVNTYIKVPEAVALGDTTSYLEGAGMQLSDPAFFSERRPWGILLTYKLLGGSLQTIGHAQLSYSTVSWLFLAWILTGSLKTGAGKLLGFSCTLGISLSPTVQVWNHAGLSESFSISTLIFILAFFIGLLQQWRCQFFLALILFFTFWVSIHEVNLYLGLLAAVTLFVFGFLHGHFRIFWILSFSLALVLVINSYLSSRYALPRWALPVAEVITKRILPVPGYLDYFSERGMPVTPELMALSGRWAHSDNYAILNDSRLREFSNWLFQDAKTVYSRFLIEHPVYTLTMPLLNMDEMLAVDFSGLIPDYEPALPTMVNEFFFPINSFWGFFGISIILFVFILWKYRREPSRVFWLLVLYFIFSIPYLYLAWHGDALDLARHASIANIQFHLGIWLLFFFFLDRIVASRVGNQTGKPF